ncbi:MAG: hypothetical protein CMF72_19805 [Mameliella sp.]|nr:hypothetical protein [Mameliella sp.]|tara:strand:- start:338 stop:946 length:609 start_codon:yes stop_codon:yes gene_type:complete
MNDMAKERARREPVVPLVEIENFQGEMRGMAERAIERSGRVPNQARAMANHPVLGPIYRRFFEDLFRDSQLPQELRFLIRYKVSTLNLCLYCSAHQINYMTKLGIDRDKISNIAASDTHPAFSNRERVALAIAEAVTLDAANIPDSLIEEFRAQFSAQEMVEVTVVSGAMGFMNKVNDALRIPVEDEAIDLVGQGVDSDQFT